MHVIKAEDGWDVWSNGEMTHTPQYQSQEYNSEVWRVSILYSGPSNETWGTPLDTFAHWKGNSDTCPLALPNRVVLDPFQKSFPPALNFLPKGLLAVPEVHKKPIIPLYKMLQTDGEACRQWNWTDSIP